MFGTTKKKLITAYAADTTSVTLEQCEAVALWKHLLQGNDHMLHNFAAAAHQPNCRKRNERFRLGCLSFQVVVAEPKKKTTKSKPEIMEMKRARQQTLVDSEAAMIEELLV